MSRLQHVKLLQIAHILPNFVQLKFESENRLEHISTKFESENHLEHMHICMHIDLCI